MAGARVAVSRLDQQRDRLDLGPELQPRTQLQAHADTSVLNVLPATITDVSVQPGGQVQIQLDASGQRLLARVSHHSVERLQLRPGLQLWAQIKAVALLV